MPQQKGIIFKSHDKRQNIRPNLYITTKGTLYQYAWILFCKVCKEKSQILWDESEHISHIPQFQSLYGISEKDTKTALRHGILG